MGNDGRGLAFRQDPIQRCLCHRTGRWPNPVTFGLYSPAFGGVWRSILYAAWVQQSQNIGVRIYSRWHGVPGRNFSRKPRANRAPLIREILAVLDLPRPLEVVDEAPIEDVVSPLGVLPLHFPCPRTKIRWKGWEDRKFKRIAYQIDGGFKGVEKNPRPVDIPVIESFLPGYRLIRLGKHLSVRQCLEEASTCDLFFGVDSGMQQMCYTLGVPIFLLTYRQDPFILFVWHGDRHAIHCRNTGDLVFKARRFLGLEA